MTPRSVFEASVDRHLRRLCKAVRGAADDGDHLGDAGHAASFVSVERYLHCPPVFDTLSDKLQHALGDLRGKGRLDEEAISKAMREIRLALLEADVNFQVVKDFVAQVRERATGQDVLKGLDAGQQVVKIVHEELTALMGSGDSRLAFGKPPTVILLAGLQGSGKTTTSAKLALTAAQGREEAGARSRPTCSGRPRSTSSSSSAARSRFPSTAATRRTRSRWSSTGLQAARDAGNDVVIVDTAGRLHVDEELMEELARVRDAAKPTNVLLVLDAMTGQEAVNVAQSFFRSGSRSTASS